MTNISELWKKIINNKMQSFIILLFIGAGIVGIFCCFNIKQELICSNFYGCKIGNIYIPNPNHILLYFAFVATSLTGMAIYNQFKMQKNDLDHKNILSTLHILCNNFNRVEKYFLSIEDFNNVTSTNDKEKSLMESGFNVCIDYDYQDNRIYYASYYDLDFIVPGFWYINSGEVR